MTLPIDSIQKPGGVTVKIEGDMRVEAQPQYAGYVTVAVDIDLDGKKYTVRRYFAENLFRGVDDANVKTQMAEMVGKMVNLGIAWNLGHQKKDGQKISEIALQRDQNRIVRKIGTGQDQRNLDTDLPAKLGRYENEPVKAANRTKREALEILSGIFRTATATLDPTLEFRDAGERDIDEEDDTDVGDASKSYDSAIQDYQQKVERFQKIINAAANGITPELEQGSREVIKDITRALDQVEQFAPEEAKEEIGKRRSFWNRMNLSDYMVARGISEIQSIDNQLEEIINHALTQPNITKSLEDAFNSKYQEFIHAKARQQFTLRNSSDKDKERLNEFIKQIDAKYKDSHDLKTIVANRKAEQAKTGTSSSSTSPTPSFYETETRKMYEQGKELLNILTEGINKGVSNELEDNFHQKYKAFRLNLQHVKGNLASRNLVPEEAQNLKTYIQQLETDYRFNEPSLRRLVEQIKAKQAQPQAAAGPTQASSAATAQAQPAAAATSTFDYTQAERQAYDAAASLRRIINGTIHSGGQVFDEYEKAYQVRHKEFHAQLNAIEKTFPQVSAHPAREEGARRYLQRLRDDYKDPSLKAYMANYRTRLEASQRESASAASSPNLSTSHPLHQAPEDGKRTPPATTIKMEDEEPTPTSANLTPDYNTILTLQRPPIQSTPAAARQATQAAVPPRAKSQAELEIDKQRMQLEAEAARLKQMKKVTVQPSYYQETDKHLKEGATKLFALVKNAKKSEKVTDEAEAEYKSAFESFKGNLTQVEAFLPSIANRIPQGEEQVKASIEGYREIFKESSLRALARKKTRKGKAEAPPEVTNVKSSPVQANKEKFERHALALTQLVERVIGSIREENTINQDDEMTYGREREGFREALEDLEAAIRNQREQSAQDQQFLDKVDAVRNTFEETTLREWIKNRSTNLMQEGQMEPIRAESPPPLASITEIEETPTREINFPKPQLTEQEKIDLKKRINGIISEVEELEILNDNYFGNITVSEEAKLTDLPIRRPFVQGPISEEEIDREIAERVRTSSDFSDAEVDALVRERAEFNKLTSRERNELRVKEQLENFGKAFGNLYETITELVADLNLEETRLLRMLDNFTIQRERLLRSHHELIGLSPTLDDKTPQGLREAVEQAKTVHEKLKNTLTANLLHSFGIGDMERYNDELAEVHKEISGIVEAIKAKQVQNP